jgi:hypothetical protein
MNFNEVIRVQGRVLSLSEVSQIQQLVEQHPQWSRHRLAKELCLRWDWRTALGQLKTFAARSLLLKLEQRQLLRLPCLRVEKQRTPWGLRADCPPPLPPAAVVEGSLEQLGPLSWQLCPYGTSSRQRALGYLRQYHYLGCTRPVGTHLLYLVQDSQGRDVAVHLVGAAAWQCGPRDRYIGWSAQARQSNLPQIANHSRFLILPWLQVCHLASHLLGQLTRRLARDWHQHHGWSLVLLETYVEEGRFCGTAYRAANWQWVGLTTGRTRQQKQHRASAPRKSVWVYPLARQFRKLLATVQQPERRACV